MHIGLLSLLTHYTYGAQKILEGKYLATRMLSSDYGFAWGNTLDLLKQHDLNLLNPELTVEPVLPGAADVMAKILKTGKIEALNAANHFLLDAELESTLKELHAVDIKTVGIGINAQQARQTIILQHQNIRIGIIGFTTQTTCTHQENKHLFCAPMGDVEAIKNDIIHLKEQAYIVIALIQWGSEQAEPMDVYRQYAHALIDLGVDILHGTGSHVYLGVENYNNKLIIYDSGDLVEDLLDPNNNWHRSFIYTVMLEKNNIKQVTLNPVLIKENKLQPATGQNKIEALALMQEISKNLGTSISDKGIITF